MHIHDIRKAAAHVVPSARQLAFMQQPFYAFVHFSPNTYTGLEWGTGQEDPAIFNPAELDCDQWVAAIKSAGMTGLVLTAKHHDGFCLWQTQTTCHSVRSSPWQNGQGDVVREAAEACRRGGIRFGVYLSPWDRHCPLYGTDQYNDYYKAQLTELLTGYGELFYVWFDGACGEGPNGKRQTYDFDGYIDLIRKYQPNACIFHESGPDIRWIGNESGTSRDSEWMAVPHELCFRAAQQTEHGTPGDLSGISCTWPDLGSDEVIAKSRGLAFCPAETDMSIRPGWFYHTKEEPHPLARLQQTYLTSVGGSSTFNLNVPPMPSGRFDPRDVQRLQELGSWIRSTFGTNLAAASPVITEEAGGIQQFRVTLPEAASVRYITLMEDAAKGQRTVRFSILADGAVRYRGTTIGTRRICDLGEAYGLQNLTVRIDECRGVLPSLRILVHA